MVSEHTIHDLGVLGSDTSHMDSLIDSYPEHDMILSIHTLVRLWLYGSLPLQRNEQCPCF